MFPKDGCGDEDEDEDEETSVYPDIVGRARSISVSFESIYHSI